MRHLFAVLQGKTEIRPADDPKGKRICTVPQDTEKETEFCRVGSLFQPGGRQTGEQERIDFQPPEQHRDRQHEF